MSEVRPRPVARQSLAPLWGGAALMVLVLVAYWPALHGGFIWDDDGHVTRPDLRSLAGLVRIWFKLGATQQYYPVLHTAFWLEHRLWGDSPFGYHLLNVLLHGLAAGLVARVLLRLRSGVPLAAWSAAGLFALHPVAVESVAWISEQKNTLSAVFYLSSALAFLRYQDSRGRAACGGALLWFLLALGTKTVSATLPAGLLVALWWRNGGSLSWRRDVLPLLPWFIPALGAGLLTAWVERTYIGAQGAAFQLGAIDRILIAGRVVVFYLGKLVWPAHLIFIYPRWVVSAQVAAQYVFPLGVGVVLACFFAIRKRFPGPLAAALYFGGTLFPALGFFNVYPFVFSFVADHFQYLAALGIYAAAGGLIAAIWARCSPKTQLPLAGALGLLLMGLGFLTWRQAGTYRDLDSLYRTTLAENPDAWLAHDNLGVVLARRGNLSAAIEHYQAALRLNPNYPETYNNLGNALARTHEWPSAFAAYRRAVEIRPAFVQAQLDWANALADAGHDSEAMARYQTVIAQQPSNPEAHYRLGNVLGNLGQFEPAAAQYRAALTIQASFPEAEANLGLALVNLNRTDEAIEHLRRAVRLNPRYAEAHAYLGFALSHAGRPNDAIAEYRAALAINPRDANVHYQLAHALSAVGRTTEAMQELDASEPPLPAPR